MKPMAMKEVNFKESNLLNKQGGRMNNRVTTMKMNVRPTAARGTHMIHTEHPLVVGVDLDVQEEVGDSQVELISYDNEVTDDREEAVDDL